MSYEKFDPDKEDILKVAIKYNGNVSAIAQEYKIARSVMYEYFKRDPLGKQVIDTVRSFNTCSDLDLAEHVNRANMANYKENPAIAQRAAEFTLKYKGRDRDWKEDATKDSSINEDEISLTLELAKEKHLLREQIRILKEKHEPETRTEPLRSEQETEYMVRSSEVWEDLQ